jgi:hypothetical protein
MSNAGPNGTHNVPKFLFEEALISSKSIDCTYSTDTGDYPITVSEETRRIKKMERMERKLHICICLVTPIISQVGMGRNLLLLKI